MGQQPKTNTEVENQSNLKISSFVGALQKQICVTKLKIPQLGFLK
jgi:hypothetical protein